MNAGMYLYVDVHSLHIGYVLMHDARTRSLLLAAVPRSSFMMGYMRPCFRRKGTHIYHTETYTLQYGCKFIYRSFCMHDVSALLCLIGKVSVTKNVAPGCVLKKLKSARETPVLQTKPYLHRTACNLKYMCSYLSLILV